MRVEYFTPKVTICCIEVRAELAASIKYTGENERMSPKKRNLFQ